MHLKSYVIDGTLLRTRSANWSPTGLKRQDNDLRYEVDPVLVRLFEACFVEGWDRPNNRFALIVRGYIQRLLGMWMSFAFSYLHFCHRWGASVDGKNAVGGQDLLQLQVLPCKPGTERASWRAVLRPLRHA